MQRLLFPIFLSILSVCSSEPVFAIGLHIRGIDAFSEEYHIEKVEPKGIRSCSVWLSKLTGNGTVDSDLDPRIGKAISKSNDLFKDRRSWEDEAFLLSRFDIAKKFATRSHYSLVVNRKTGEVAGGIAMTVAR